MAYAVGDYVRLLNDEVGTAQGPSREHGDDEMREVPAGSVCEIFGIEETPRWLTLHFALDDSGPREPYRVEIIVGEDAVEPTDPPPRHGWDGVMAPPPADLGI